MWVKTALLLSVLYPDTTAIKKTRHYLESPFGDWKEYHSGYRVQRINANGRVEVIEKTLSKSVLDSGTFLTDEVVNYVKASGDTSDLIVAVIDRKLGGPGNETFNAVPMNPSTEEIWRREVTDPIYNYILENRSEELFLSLMPFYKTLNSVRPYGFGVFVTIGFLSNVHLVKGYIPNPTKAAMPHAIVPHLYSTGQERTIRIWGTTYNRLEIRGSKLRNWTVRVEKAEKVVRFGDLNTGTDIDEINRMHSRKLSGNDVDVPGQLISRELGGKGDDPYNVVPMDPTAVGEMKTKVEAPIAAFICKSNKDLSVVLSVIVVYDNDFSTRPAGFITISRGLDSDFKMFIPNQG